MPDDPRLTLELFPLWLDRACAIGPVVLLIDGIDQLTDMDGEASALRWLPGTIPMNCSLVLSITSGTPCASARTYEQ